MKVFNLICLVVFACFQASQAENLKVIDGGLSGDGITTRYWDCCKPSCAWAQTEADTGLKVPVQSCAKDGVTHIDDKQQSGCDANGTSFPCSAQTCWPANSTFAYGFIAASFTGGVDNSQCCNCLLLSFTGALTGKSMVAQIINTGAPLASNQFDITIPGGGVGVYTQGCINQWNAPADGWGGQWDSPNAINSIEGCDQLPEGLQEGCRFRFDFMEGVSNPNVTFVQVECPDALNAVTQCQRA